MPPSVNHIYTRSRSGRVVLSAEAMAYRGVVRCLLGHWEPVMQGPVIVRIMVYRKRRHGDLDNILKALLDALNGVAYRDDSQVVEIRAQRFDDPCAPRVEIMVTQPGEAE